jgi:hypothetical protein
MWQSTKSQKMRVVELLDGCSGMQPVSSFKFQVSSGKIESPAA